MLLKLITLLSLILLASATNPCSPDFQNLAGDDCTDTCPLNSGTNGEQCVCLGGFQLSADQTSCECQTGYLDLLQSSCVPNCPALSSPLGKVCLCNNPFFFDGSYCVCTGTDRVNLEGDGCISSCPRRSTDVNGQCVCDNTFTKNSDGSMCICATGFLEPDGNYCMAGCPAGSTDIGEGVCKCDNPNLSGTLCDVCNGVYSMDGVTCIATCPPRTYLPTAECACLMGYELTSNLDGCICPVGELVDLDGVTCVTICSAGGVDNDGDAICECANGYSGASCDVCLGVIGIDWTTCMTSCPDRSSDGGGSGMCGCDHPYISTGNSCICSGTDLIDIDGTSCVSGCPERASDNDGICSCDVPFVEIGGTCGCANSEKISLDGSSCLAGCPSNSSPNNGKCECDSGYFLDGSVCTDTCPNVKNLDATACISQCPAHSTNIAGQCVCQTSFQISGDGESCVCTGTDDKISVDGSSCISSCPARSSLSNGQCVCDPSFQANGDTCGCDTGLKINLAGTGCISGCPQDSSAVNGACECFTGFTIAGDLNSCECAGGKSISVDGASCEIGCSTAHSSVVGTQCVCDNNFVQVGSNCLCDVDKVLNIVGDYCIDSCTRGAFVSSGQCQCYFAFVVNGNACECPASDPFISIDGSYCEPTCPSYSSNDNGQCACYGTFVKNGNTCECPTGKKINLAGTACVSDCPIHSSDQGGQCQCDSPWVLETVSKASCVCSTSLHLSLDELNCITPCPDHTIIVNNACICNSASNFALSFDQQSCECTTGTILDSSSVTCLPACPTLSPPNNVPPYCYECDGTCKTCSGPDSNECLTCYSGYQLSTSKTCNAITKTTTKSSTSGEVAKTTQIISSASLAASSVVSVGNSGAIRVSLVGNMFQYLKFLNISYSEDLSDMLENLSSQFLPFTIDVEIPSLMTNEGNYKTLPYQFTKYEEIHPSFLMNFWDDLSILVVVIGIVGVLVALQFIVNKFYKQKTMWKFVFSKASLMAQSFLLTYTYNDLGNIIFFGLLDFKSAKKYSGVHVLNLIIAISLLLTEVGILTLHYTLLMKYRRIKSARLNPNRTKEIEEFLGKHENLKAFFEDFNDFSFIQQCFLLVAIFRDMLCNLILVTLYQYPLAESTCFMVFSLLMIVYILYSGPFKHILHAIQQILCEGILLLVNTSVFINAVLDHIDSNDDDLREKIGSIVVVSNTVFNFVPMAFLAIVLWQFSKELYAYIKGWMNKRKMAKGSKKEDLSFKADCSKMTLRDLSLEGPVRNSFTGVINGENINTTMIAQHKFNEDMESSQGQMTNLESKIMSKDSSGIFEMKLDGGDQGQDEFIIGNAKEKSNYWPNQNNRTRKMKIKKRRMFPSPQGNGLNIEEMIDQIKLESNDTSK